MTCDYAACGKPGTHQVDGWQFCPAHRVAHTEDYPTAGPVVDGELACRDKRGTDAGNSRHRRADQPACRPCLDAATEAARVRKERNNTRLLSLSEAS